MPTNSLIVRNSGKFKPSYVASKEFFRSKERVSQICGFACMKDTFLSCPEGDERVNYIETTTDLPKSQTIQCYLMFLRSVKFLSQLKKFATYHG